MGTPGGFAHAGVTKGLLLATGAATLAARAHGHGRAAPLLLRGLGAGFAYRSPSQLLFGCLLLYQFRLLERQLGSAKYGAYVASVTGLSYALQLAASRLLRLGGAAPLLPVPLPLALASFVPFALDVPATSSFSFMGFSASEKAFVYLSGLQLLLAIGRRGVPAGALCLLAGALHRANFLGLRKLQLPRVLVRAIAHAFGPLLGDGGGPVLVLPGAARPGGAPGRGGSGGGGPPGLHIGGGGGGAVAPGLRQPPPGPPVEAAPEAVETLVGMGFDRARAAEALRRTGNDVQAAIAQLVT